jgi:uncharacterized membrane protein
MTSMNPAFSGGELRRADIARGEEDRGMFRRGQQQNVGTGERLASGIAGVVLLKLGLGRRSLTGKLLMGTLGGAMIQRAVTGHCSVYQACGCSSAQQHPARAEDYFERGIHVETSQMVAADAGKLYAFWHDFSNLPQVMRHVQSVERLTDTRSRWTACGPMGRTVSWEAEVIHDVPNELISWKSVGDSDVENAGTVLFRPGKGQTEVRVVLDYIPPAGRVGKLVAQLFGEAPEQTIREDLRRFKSLMETGEVATTGGQARG